MHDTRRLTETQGSGMADDILRRIVETKKEEVRALQAREGEIRARLGEAPAPRDLAAAFRQGGTVAVMAEVKRRSPGAGEIRPEVDPGELGREYERGGAAAVSVLTDREYFGGSLDDLVQVRQSVKIPVFRKEFIIHPLQLLEARAAGADGTLLIARILEEEALGELHEEAVELGLTPLVEVHQEEELEQALAAGARLIGINNRDLRTFGTSLDVTLRLLPLLPPDAVVISESGIRTPEDVERLGEAGVHGVLVGESLLRLPHPEGGVAALAGRRRRPREGEGIRA